MSPVNLDISVCEVSTLLLASSSSTSSPALSTSHTDRSHSRGDIPDENTDPLVFSVCVDPTRSLRIGTSSCDGSQEIYAFDRKENFEYDNLFEFPLKEEVVSHCQFVPRFDNFVETQTPCFGPFNSDDDDDDLTSLSWLQDANLLKNLTGTYQRPRDDPRKLKELTNRTSEIFDDVQPVLLVKDRLGQRKSSLQCCITGKPLFSFSCLIFMAIESSPGRSLPVKSIYDWIVRNFPYFRSAPAGWKNSVRHNLSFNRCFRNSQIENRSGFKKGSRWYVDSRYRSKLLQALRKSHLYGNRSLILQQPHFFDEPEPDRSSDERLKNGHNGSDETDFDVASTLASLSSLIDRQKQLDQSSSGNDGDLAADCTPCATIDHDYSIQVKKQNRSSYCNKAREDIRIKDGERKVKTKCQDESQKMRKHGAGMKAKEFKTFKRAKNPKDLISSRAHSGKLTGSKSPGLPLLAKAVDDDEQRKMEGIDALLNLAAAGNGRSLKNN